MRGDTLINTPPPPHPSPRKAPQRKSLGVYPHPSFAPARKTFQTGILRTGYPPLSFLYSMQFDVACIVHLSIWICMDLYVFVEKHNVISCHAFFENAQLLQVVPGRECLTFAELSQVVVFCRNVSYFIAKLTPRSHLRRKHSFIFPRLVHIC